ncbi:MAG: SEL1-like repeat protein [Cyanobacteria bacterium REEB446]|nr:SEL1-like repeat protein [Cyanobacteria bacterium REEB446]
MVFAVLKYVADKWEAFTKNYDFFLPDQAGYNPLMRAVSKGNEKAVERILNKAEAKLSIDEMKKFLFQADKDGRNVLMLPALKDNKEMVELILNKVEAILSPSELAEFLSGRVIGGNVNSENDKYIVDSPEPAIIHKISDSPKLAIIRKNFSRLIRSAESGDVKASIQLGDMYMGIFEPKLIEFKVRAKMLGLEQNTALAFKWYKKAAELGDMDAMFTIAEISYQSGDYDAALLWYTRTSYNNVKSMMMLGWMYSSGTLPLHVPRDCKIAFSWYKKAAVVGSAEAMYELGRMCSEGEGTLKDPQQAKYWIKKAYEAGYEDAEKLWNELELWKY